MYSPYLYARSTELLCLRDLVAKGVSLNGLLPILEPINVNTRNLLTCLNVWNSDIIVILNPYQEDFSSHNNVLTLNQNLSSVLSTQNDTGDFYVIDLEAMQGITLNYGKEYEKVKNDENMKAYFNEAHFLMENMTKRNQTVLIVANALVNIQSGYFLYDDELYPCTLSQLASETGFHESTISRTLNNKYYSFNGEAYPLKKLLVSQTASGDSSDSIKKAIVELVDDEDKEHPLSDNQILKKLEELELHCSRRVIVKYRQQLNIPSSTKRKVLKKVG